MKIGLVGLGRMGRAIQARLADQRRRCDRLGPRRGGDEAAAEQRHDDRRASPRGRRCRRRHRDLDHHRRQWRAEHLPRQGRIPDRRRARQAVHRDEHAAADDRARACAGGGSRRRPADQFAGARHHPLGARRQAVRHGRRQSRRTSSRPSGAGKAHPQDRPHGAERRGLRHEARGQSRARGVHPGDGGVARAWHARGPGLAADARRAGRSADRQRLVRREEEAACRASRTTSRSI